MTDDALDVLVAEIGRRILTDLDALPELVRRADDDLEALVARLARTDPLRPFE